MKENDINELANYCLNCKTKPCKSGCPLGNDIPEFIKNIKEQNFEQAYKILSKTTVLESVCGRICPHMSQCMGKCVRGIKSNPVNIGILEAFVGDIAIKNGFNMCELDDSDEFTKNVEITKGIEEINDKKVAIVGSGPAGLTCAAFLARAGVQVTIFEKKDKLGGLLRHGIPEFRLPKEILDSTIEKVINLGIKVEFNKELGKNISINKLKEEYDAVFISIGANIPWKMAIEGESLNGVYGGNSLLEYNTHPEYKGKKVAIIGGGNVAMDCARTINKKGAENVYIIYRRSEEQMPAEKKEVEDAKKEGIEFIFQTNLVKIIGENKVERIECVKTDLIKKEGDTRLSPINIEGSNFELEMDYVIMAIGSMPEEKVISSLGLELDKKGYIRVDENYETSIENVFAGGDVCGTEATVAWAAKTGRETAKYIINKFKNKEKE